MTWDEELEVVIQRNWQPGEVFNLAAVYRFEEHFGELHPNNSFIKAKLRQTLQHLRGSGVIEFVDDRGTYRRIR